MNLGMLQNDFFFFYFDCALGANRAGAGSQSQMFSSVRDSHKSHFCHVYPPEWSQRENKHPQTAADMTRKLRVPPSRTSLSVFSFICWMCRGASANHRAARLLCWNFYTEYLERIFSFSAPLFCRTEFKLCLANKRATLTYSVLYSLQWLFSSVARPFQKPLLYISMNSLRLLKRMNINQLVVKKWDRISHQRHGGRTAKQRL